MSASYPKLTKTRIVLFFVVLATLAWFLFPRNLFLVRLHEGQFESDKAESDYVEYLSANPANKDIALRLKELYEKKGQPEKMLPFFKKLVSVRKNDYDLSKNYLDFLEQLSLKAEAYEWRQEMVRRFEGNKEIPRKEMVAYLEDALQYALWNQKHEEAYLILQQLLHFDPQSEEYQAKVLQLDSGLKNHKLYIEHLQKRIETANSSEEKESNAEELFEVFRAEKDYKNAEQLLKKWLGQQTHSTRWRYHALKLAEDKNDKSAQILEAKNIYEALENTEEKKQMAYLLAYLASELNQQDQAIEYLQFILNQNPQDEKALTQKMQIYLYKSKSTEQLAFFENYLSKYPNLQMAKDLAWLYQASAPSLLEGVLNFLEKLFPHEMLWLEIRYAEALKSNNKLLALQLLLQLDQKRKLNESELKTLLFLYQDLEKREAFNLILNRVIKEYPSAENFKLYGLNQYYQQNYVPAVEYLKKAYEQGLKDQELLYALSEMSLINKEEQNFKLYATEFLQSLNQKSKSKSLTLQEKQMQLKTRWKLKEEVQAQNFEELLKQQEEPGLRYDYVQYLLQNKQHAEAEKQIEYIRTSKNNFKEQQEWVNQLREQLVYASYENKEYSLAQNNFERLSLAQKNKMKDLEVALKENLASKINAYYDWTHFGKSRFDSFHLDSFSRLGERYSLLASLHFSNFQEDLLNIDGQFVKISAALQGTQQNFIWSAGLEFGSSPSRNTPSPFVNFQFNPSDQYQLRLKYQNRELYTVIPSSVSEGALQDELLLQQSGVVGKHLFWNFNAEANRQVLKSGESSKGYSLNPGAQWVFFQKPYLSLGYQYQWARQEGEAYFSKVSLIEKINAHSLSLSYSQKLLDHLTIDLYAFATEDSSRNLSLFEGDLWGIEGGLRYDFAKNWSLFTRYQYARESSQTANTGAYHQLSSGINYYWGFHGK